MVMLSEVSDQILHTAALPTTVASACQVALSRHGRLFSATPAWADLFLAWIAAVADVPHDLFLSAAVACEYMAAGYDLLDAAAPGEPDLTTRAASDALLRLSQDLLLGLGVRADCRLRASAVLRRAGDRALVAQHQDTALRRMPSASPEVVLSILRRRSGTLVAATCQCATLLADAPWRTVGLAGRFGMALGCAAQLEDDMADREEDVASGRKTLAVLLTHLHPTAPELVVATMWALIHHYLYEAARALTRLPHDRRTEALWMLLPTTLRAA